MSRRRLRLASYLATMVMTSAVAALVCAPPTVDAASPSPTWAKLKAAAVGAPAARAQPAMAYDPGDGYVLLFGGDGPSRIHADTWDFADGLWTQLMPPSHPSARYGASLVWDAADDYMLLFGGQSSKGGMLGDTWAFRAGAWTQLHPTLSPPARTDYAMTYDAADHEVLLFGGVDFGTGTYYADTWAFSGGQWTQLSPSTSPSPRAGSEITYDQADGYIVLFGGTADYSCVCGLGDTWKFSGDAWTQLTQSVSPDTRYTYAMTFDSALQAVLFFGGWHASGGCGDVTGDTWEFEAGAWMELSPTSSPPARSGMGLADDPDLSGAVLFGGSSGTCGAPGPTYRDTRLFG